MPAKTSAPTKSKDFKFIKISVLNKIDKNIYQYKKILIIFKTQTNHHHILYTKQRIKLHFRLNLQILNKLIIIYLYPK